MIFAQCAQRSQKSEQSQEVHQAVFADRDNLYIGTRFIPAGDMEKVEIHKKDFTYSVNVESKDGSRLTFSLLYSVEKDRFVKFIKDHGINVIDT